MKVKIEILSWKVNQIHQRVCSPKSQKVLYKLLATLVIVQISIDDTSWNYLFSGFNSILVVDRIKS